MTDHIDLVHIDDDKDDVRNTKRSNSGEPSSAVKTQKVSYHTFGQPPSVVITEEGIISISKLAQGPFEVLEAGNNKSLETTYRHLFVPPQVHKQNDTNSRVCIICFHRSGDVKKSLKKDVMITGKHDTNFLSFSNFKKHLEDVHPEQLLIEDQPKKVIDVAPKKISTSTTIAPTSERTLLNSNFLIRKSSDPDPSVLKYICIYSCFTPTLLLLLLFCV
jgi:hypothetical protein